MKLDTSEVQKWFPFALIAALVIIFVIGIISYKDKPITKEVAEEYTKQYIACLSYAEKITTDLRKVEALRECRKLVN